MPERYAELLGERDRGRRGRARPGSRTSIRGFYVACYLRAWALEVDWRRGAARSASASAWFAERARRGSWLRGLWARGQRLDAERLLDEAAGRRLDFGRLASGPEPWAGYRLARPTCREPSEEVQGGSKREWWRHADQVQKAIDDLRSAGEKATGDVRSSIDAAVARLKDVSGDATSRAQDQVSNWRDTLDKATEDVRKELAKLAVRAQTSTEALDEIDQGDRRAPQGRSSGSTS